MAAPKKARCGRRIFRHLCFFCSPKEGVKATKNSHAGCPGEYDRDSSVTGKLHVVCTCKCQIGKILYCRPPEQGKRSPAKAPRRKKP